MLRVTSETEVEPIRLPGRDVFNLITDAENLSVGVDIIEVGGRTAPPHYHPESEAAIYLIHGRLKVICDEAEAEMNAGDIVLIPPGSTHIAENIGEGEAKILFCFSPPVRTGDWVEIAEQAR